MLGTTDFVSLSCTNGYLGIHAQDAHELTAKDFH